MDIHPLTNHEIARLGGEQRLRQAEEAQLAREARAMEPSERPAKSARFRRLRRLRSRGATALPAALIVVGVVLASSQVAQAHNTALVLDCGEGRGAGRLRRDGPATLRCRAGIAVARAATAPCAC